uniref:Transposon Ty3-G Gag-Pol polyprotein n=1 Tax=Cajanus cajan TaxID=3821 RepID=A0A151R595_CAJCA|nr:Transposon Ty3-G Gag-Pol polyprotein [Cajanus cajan]
MRITGYYNKKPLHILIDNGSTHNFLDVHIAKKLCCRIDNLEPMHVTVADDNKLNIEAVVKDFKWTIQQTMFTSDMMLLSLGCCDLVLGIEWLITLGNITWNFDKLSMQFYAQGRKHVLRTSPGLLQPLLIPNHIWQHINMDFIEGLPSSTGKQVIFVVVNRLSKAAHFVGLSHPYQASDVAQTFLDNIFKLHGFPETITSDRDPTFISNFWQEFMQLQRVETRLSSSYHPQTDGQSEVVNRCLETYLRCMCSDTPT